MISSKINIQVRFNDIDVAGHVHNAAYFLYFETGRIDFFKKVADENWNWSKLGILVARNEADYIKSIKLEDKVIVETTCEDLGKKSITLAYHIFREDKDGIKELCTKGRSILVCMNYETGESEEVFEEWKQVLLDN